MAPEDPLDPADAATASAADGEEASTGRRRRESRRQGRERRAALAWWTQPGVLVFLLALLLVVAGWVLVIRHGQRIPVREATLDGLHLELNQARWVLDQMDHGENFQRPSTMAPGMPEWGSQRMTLDVAFENVSDSSRIYDGSEFSLVPEIGPPVPPVGAQVGRAPLEAGQRLNTTIHFDFDTTRPHGKLLVEWRRRGHSVFLPIPEPAEHYHLRPLGGEVALPLDVRLLLPIGDAERGKALYDGTLGCIACHGDVARPGSNNFGPDLALLAEEAGTRIEGVSAAQYIYDSIREPGAFIAPHCKDGPCQTPSAMPEYASLMTLQDFADVVTYLLGTPQP
ncbi:MAG: c-type cytochrome [Acidobacteria bacterium]|nr:c-type cytochrome [Acidobacteriota bacterium]